MDELVVQLASQAGIDATIAEKSVGMILSFLRSEGPSDTVQLLIDEIPGAEAAIASADSTPLATLMGGGLMALATRLMNLGLGIAEIQNIARELFRFGRNKIGVQQIGEIIARTPGISQFV